MTSRVHPKYKTKYHVGHGPESERALVQRGDVTVWLSADATDAWKPSPAGRPGGQRRFSDLAIEPALTRRLVFRLPWRQTEGVLRSVLAFLGSDLDAPDHTTLSRRSQRLDVKRRVPVKGPIHLIVDSTGLSVVGEGAWAAVKHGGRGKRGGKKLHLGVDRSGVIVAQARTEATVDDATTGIHVMDVVAGDLASVTADTAGVVATRTVEAKRSNEGGSQRPMLEDAGRPSSGIRFKTLHASSVSVCRPPGVRARRPSPMIDL